MSDLVFEDKLILFHLFGFIPVSATSIVDILIVAFIIYRVLGLIRGTRAAQILAGLFLVITLAMAAPLFEMDALVWLLEQVRSILLILLVILFQPELRRFLGALGQSPAFRWLYKTESSHVVDEVATAAEQMASRGFGALMVMVRDVQLDPIVDSGVPLNAQVSADLLTTIFTPRSPLHDQAAVIRGERLVAARCTLPLAEDVDDQRLGTRHRAALGLSQESDAVTVVVSEESRIISLAIGGVLVRGLAGAELRQRLSELMAPKGEALVAANGDED